MRIFYSIYVKNAGRKRSYRKKLLFYAHKTAVRHTLQHELSVAGEGGILGRGGSLTTRGVPSWLHGESVAQCRVFCNSTCKNSIFRDKIARVTQKNLLDVPSVAGFSEKSSHQIRPFADFLHLFSAGRGLQESQQNGLQFLVKSCIMRANLSFDRFRPKSTIDLTPDWAV